MSIHSELKAIKRKIQELDYERSILIERRRELIKQFQQESSTKVQLNHSTANITTDEKVQIFQNLFIGRDDVYARKVQYGYVPECTNFGQRELCAKATNKNIVKCTECPNRQLAKLTPKVLRQHLIGHDTKKRPLVIGLYPLMPGDVCRLLAVDLDSKDYQKEALALYNVCASHDIPIYIERSRSGNGVHLWIFFSEPVKAAQARTMGRILLSETALRLGSNTLTSFDRLFPNQDSMPKGGFGNLIALPYQYPAREHGNSVFVDHNFIPYQDVWGFLSSIKKMTAHDVRAFLARKGLSLSNSEKIKAKPLSPDYFEITSDNACVEKDQTKRTDLAKGLPQPVQVILSEGIHFKLQGLTPALRSELRDVATFHNPEFYEREKKHLSTRGIARVITLAKEVEDDLVLPRGVLEKVESIFRSNHIDYDIVNRESMGLGLNITFLGTLRSQQALVCKAVLKHNDGIVAASTGFGKTVLGLYAIAQRAVSTLIIVNRQQLLTQWMVKATSFLDIKREEIGTIKAGKNCLTGIVDIVTVQSLARVSDLRQILSSYGQIIIDECHHAASYQYQTILNSCSCRYVLGLTATPTRKDGLMPKVIMQCGPIRYRVNNRREAQSSSFMRTLYIRKTNFSFNGRIPLNKVRKIDITRCYAMLAVDEKRNQQIVNDVFGLLDENRHPVIITKRRDHLEALHTLLKDKVDVIVLHGGINKKKASTLIEQFNALSQSSRVVLIATGQFLGEGFDAPRLDTLLLAMPITGYNDMTQYLGRLARLYDGKVELRVIDYVDDGDSQCGVFRKMFAKRLKCYRIHDFRELTTNELGI